MMDFADQAKREAFVARNGRKLDQQWAAGVNWYEREIQGQPQHAAMFVQFLLECEPEQLRGLSDDPLRVVLRLARVALCEVVNRHVSKSLDQKGG